MTENEASKIIENIPVAQADCDNMGEIVEACTVAQKALEEIQQYRAIETELKEKYHANVDIKMLMQHFIETIFKGEKHEGFCILTNEDAKMWGAYRAIGTVEECRTAMERMKPSSKVRGISLTHDVGRVGNCPNCNRFVVEKYNDYCPKCRKKLAWSE